jgi:hypothetical protein
VLFSLVYIYTSNKDPSYTIYQTVLQRHVSSAMQRSKPLSIPDPVISLLRTTWEDITYTSGRFRLFSVYCCESLSQLHLKCFILGSLIEFADWGKKSVSCKYFAVQHNWLTKMASRFERFQCKLQCCSAEILKTPFVSTIPNIQDKIPLRTILPAWSLKGIPLVFIILI